MLALSVQAVVACYATVPRVCTLVLFMPYPMSVWIVILPMKCCLIHSKGTVSITDSVQFIEDSDLNGENPQFTLTCISTGDPATTVIWSRDSEDVSGGCSMTL